MMESGASLLLFSTLLISWSALLAAEQDDNHFGVCSDGWVPNDVSCFRFNTTAVTQSEAHQSCTDNNAQIFIIENEDDNDFVKGFLSSENTQMWLGLRVDYRGDWYWDQGYGRRSSTYRSGRLLETPNIFRTEECSKLRTDGDWESERCDAKLPFLCHRLSLCQVGWSGEYCNNVCHCRESDPCDQMTGVCPKGCRPGWTGDQCNIEHRVPKASFHCLHSPDQSLRVELTLDAQNRNYSVVRAVDQESKPLPCTLPKIETTLSGFYVTLHRSGAFDDVSGNATSDNSSAAKLNVSDNSFTNLGIMHSSNVGDCVASQDDSGMVTWLIEFKVFKDVTTGDDITVKVTCDLAESGEMEVLHSITDESVKVDPLTAEEKEVVTSVYFVDAHSGLRQDDFHFGQTLQLRIDAEGLTFHECVMPYSCFVRPDGNKEQGLQVLDEQGCTLPGSPVRTLRVSDHTITSNEFPAFSLGSRSLTLDCNVKVIFSQLGLDCGEICERRRTPIDLFG